jgi:hypothetical protein
MQRITIGALQRNLLSKVTMSQFRSFFHAAIVCADVKFAALSSLRSFVSAHGLDSVVTSAGR